MASSSSTSSVPELDYSDRSSSTSSLRFPSSEPQDYCTPILSQPQTMDPDRRHAVLIPKSNWKRDSDASTCDTLDCHTNFGIMERRHHCRKCGGVYCQACSSKTFPLLDTSNMPFFIPPRNLPLNLLAASSPTGGFIQSRVCDDCHAQLNGEQPPSFLRARALAANMDTSLPDDDKDSITSLRIALNPETHHFSEDAMYFGPATRETYVKKPRHLRRSGSSAASSTRSSIPRSPLSSEGGVGPRRLSSTLSTADLPTTRRSSSPTATSSSHTNTPLPHCYRPVSPYYTSPLRRGSGSSGRSIALSNGGLASYPLANPSRECKLSGAAFWEPRRMAKRIDAPIIYEAHLPKDVVVRNPGDDEEDDAYSSTLPVRQKIRLHRDMWSAPFGLPEHGLEPGRVSTF